MFTETENGRMYRTLLAIPGARLVVLRDCGHFSYLECPDEVGKEMADFFDNH
jgi:pimeloyl-ACP methyl ester carboxylesterase